MTDNRTSGPTPEQVDAAAKAMCEAMPHEGGGSQIDYEDAEVMARAALVAAQGAAPQAETYDHCCQHPKCPGDSLCCCASEQRLRNAWNQWLSEFDADAKQAFRDGYQAGQNDTAPWMAPVQPSSTVDEAALIREAKAEAWDEGAYDHAELVGTWHLDRIANPYREGSET